MSARNWDQKGDRLHMQMLSCISGACTRPQHAAASHGWLFAGRMMSPRGCTDTGRRIRAREGSPLAARFEVLVSPARPRTIVTANESLPSQGAGFLCHVPSIQISQVVRQDASQAARGSACEEPGRGTLQYDNTSAALTAQYLRVANGGTAPCTLFNLRYLN